MAASADRHPPSMTPPLIQTAAWPMRFNGRQLMTAWEAMKIRHRYTCCSKRKALSFRSKQAY